MKMNQNLLKQSLPKHPSLYQCECGCSWFEEVKPLQMLKTSTPLMAYQALQPHRKLPFPILKCIKCHQYHETNLQKIPNEHLSVYYSFLEEVGKDNESG